MLENNEESEPGLGFAVTWWSIHLFFAWATITITCAILVFLYKLVSAFIIFEPPILLPTWQDVRVYIVVGLVLTVWRAFSSDSWIREEWADAKQRS